jgi:hypothetical protein
MPYDFELKMLATGKRFKRTVDGQGMISWKRYRLYVKVELKKEKIEIREFFDSLVVVYHSGTIVSYECSHEKSDVSSILNTPVFHERENQGFLHTEGKPYKESRMKTVAYLRVSKDKT